MPSSNLRGGSFHPGMREALVSGGLFGKYSSMLKTLGLSFIQTTSWAGPSAPHESSEREASSHSEPLVYTPAGSA